MARPPDNVCRKCGAPIPAGSEGCPVCHRSKGSRAMVALWAVLFAVVGVPAGLFGGCLLVFSGATVAGGSSPGPLAAGVALVAVPLFFLVMFILSLRRS